MSRARVASAWAVHEFGAGGSLFGGVDDMQRTTRESEADREGPDDTPLRPISPKLLTDTVVEAIVEAAARGHFLPGDRIVEADLARRLNVSRVPVREALRLLESQGLVENTPYRGMRLMSVTPQTMRDLRKVRLALEMLAANEIRAMAETEPQILEPLAEMVDELEALAEAGDAYGFALLDMEFHRKMVRITQNPALMRAWEPLARQLTVVIGLNTTLQTTLDAVVEEHRVLLDALRKGTPGELAEIMEAHIIEVPDAVNYELLRAGSRQSSVS